MPSILSMSRSNFISGSLGGTSGGTGDFGRCLPRAFLGMAGGDGGIDDKEELEPKGIEGIGGGGGSE